MSSFLAWCKKERSPKGLSSRIAFCIGLLYCLVCLPPWVPKFITGAELRDPSWEYVLHSAFVQQREFGTEVIFTYGPYGFLSTRMYHPATFPFMLAVWIALSVVFYVHVWRLSQLAFGSPWRAALVAGIAVRVAAFAVSTFLLSFLVLFLVRHPLPGGIADNDQHRPMRNGPARGSWNLLWGAPLVLSVGLLPLTKFTFVPAATIVLMAAGLLDVTQRRIPLASLSVIAATVVLWKLSGQPLRGLDEYLVAGFELANYYGPAMSLWETGVIDMAAVWSGATLVIVIPLLLRPSEPARNRFAGSIVPLTLLALLFLVWKVTFVRFHPLKVDRFFSAACLLVLLVTVGLAARGLVIKRRQRIAMIMSGMSLLVVTAAIPVRSSDAPPWGVQRVLWPHLQNPSAVQALLQENEWMAARHRDSCRRIRRQVSLPPLKGTIDVIPDKLALVLPRDDVTYRPRPIMQSYSVYSSWLARQNAAHYRSQQAPDYVLFRVNPIDDRFPALCDGLVWRELLKRYEVQTRLRSDLLLRRSASSRLLHVADHSTVSGTWNRPIPVPESQQGLIWCRLKLSRTLGGQVASVLYKQPHVYLEVQTKAAKRMFRFVPASGGCGFLLSPAVLTKDDFAALFEPERDPGASQVLAVRISTACEALRDWFYRDSITLEFERIRFSAAQPAIHRAGRRSERRAEPAASLDSR